MNLEPARKRLFFLLSMVLAAILSVLVLEATFALLSQTELRYSGKIWLLTRGPHRKMTVQLKHGWVSGHASRSGTVRHPSPPFQFPLHLPIQQASVPFYTRESGLLEAKKGVYEVRATSPDNGQEVYRARYTIGENGYRVTPGQSWNRKKYAVFLGDSFTFGIGVNDDETIPYYFSRSSPGYRAYNFGFGGYGPNDLLARARREKDLRVPEGGGIVIYVYYNHHATRALGGLQYLGTYGRYHPFFMEDQDQKMVQRGLFQEAVPFRVWLFGVLMKTQTVSFLRYDWPLRMNASHASFVAKMINNIKSEYLRRLPGARFLFVVAPGEGQDNAVLLPAIDELGIESLDYSGFDLDRYVGGGQRIQLDGHYRPGANSVFADQLARDIRLNLRAR